MTTSDQTACCSGCASPQEAELATHCALDDADLELRLARIRQAASRALIRGQRDGAAVHLLFSSDAAAEIRMLIEAERDCCGFIASESRETPEGLEVVLSAEPARRAAAEPLFRAFMEGEDEA